MSTAPHHSHSNSLTHLTHKPFSPKPSISHSITLIPADDEASSLLLPNPNPKQSPSMVSTPLSTSVPSNSLTSASSSSLSSSSAVLPTSSTATTAPSWFRRRLILPLFEVLKSGATPEGIALSLAFGFTGGVFPVPTVTTLACIVLAWLFRLNFPAVQITNLLMTPLNLATFIPFIRGGEWLFGVERVELSLAFFRSEPLAAIGVFWKSLLIGCLCWLVFLPCATALLYVVLKPIVRRLMTKRADLSLFSWSRPPMRRPSD
jgi:uncharacterized protein (DUF2062 family)